MFYLFPTYTPQVFVGRAACWMAYPEVSLLLGIIHCEAQDFALVLTEFHEVPKVPYIQLVKINQLARRKEVCHGHLKQLTGVIQLNFIEGW